MQENHRHDITDAIRKLYRRRILAPILFLLFTASLWASPQIRSAIFPAKLPVLSEMERFLKQGKTYLSAELTDLKFTGYTQNRFHRTTGYFYYAIDPDSRTFHVVLLSPASCGKGLPNLERISLYGKIIPADSSFDTLLSGLAADLSWTKSGIRSKVSRCYLSEPDFQFKTGLFFLVILAACSAYAAASALYCLLILFFPAFAPPCRKLGHFGNPKELFALAEEELATLPQLATEDMFITEHFFIELSRYGIALVPIREIVWIYKHSTLHKLFGYHFRISYTLHILANGRLRIHCPKNIKSDIDGIIDYLAEANHMILVGFSAENRQRAYEVLGDTGCRRRRMR